MEHATIRISKLILDEVKDFQRDEICPIKSNDSLLIAVAVYKFFNRGFLIQSEDGKKNFKKDVLDTIDMMKKDGMIDKNTRGVEKS